MKAAVFAGANRIFVTDLIDGRLKLAKRYKNVITINASKKNPAEIIRKLTGGRGVDISIEAAGSSDTIRQSIEIVRIGGKVIWAGIPAEDLISIDPHIARKKEVVIKIVRRTKYSYQKCIDIVKSGGIEIKDMITHEFKLKDIEKGFSLVENYADGVMKAIINL